MMSCLMLFLERNPECQIPREGPGVEVENVHLRIPSVIVKGDLNGAVCRNHRIKRLGPVSVLGRAR